MPVEESVPSCTSVNSDGLQCRKPLYLSQSGEYWDHAGGHVYATETAWKSLEEDHYDAMALLSGLPASHHKPEECNASFSYCAWRFHGQPR